MNPRSRRLIVTGVLLVLVLLTVAGALWQARAAHAAPTPGAPVFTVQDERIAKASGMARDADHQVFWMANEADQRGTVYAVGIDGRTRGTLDFAAKPVDVEAVAMQGNRLYVGDIGDDARKRETITVYYFDNPAPDDDRSGSYRAWDLAYPDGPHDAETLLVDKNGRLFVVTKDATGGIYAAPRQLRSGTNQLTRVGNAPAYVTDGLFLPDGRIALRTYVSVEVLDGDLYSPLARDAVPYQPRGESMALSMDNQTLLLGSEGVRTPLLRVPVPSKLIDMPAAPQSPPPSPVPTPTVTPTPEPDVTPAHDRRGTLTALLLALAASLAAAAVVWFAGRGGSRNARGLASRTRDAVTSPRRAAGESTAPEPAEPKPDAPKSTAPKSDAPKPDAPKPDAPKPEASTQPTPEPDDPPVRPRRAADGPPADDEPTRENPIVRRRQAPPAGE